MKRGDIDESTVGKSTCLEQNETEGAEYGQPEGPRRHRQESLVETRQGTLRFESTASQVNMASSRSRLLRCAWAL